MRLNWDFSEFEEFAERLQEKHDLNTALMTATQNVARVLHQYLLIQTPVKTGNLRKMWSAGDNLFFTVEAVNDGFQVTFINTARANSADGFMYGLAVNDGHTTPNGGWVMGRFFVEAAILQTSHSAQLEQIIMRELQKWWDSV